MSSELDEIWALYAQDGAEALDTAERALEALDRDSCDRAAIASLFRALHTFKGNARLVGFGVLEKAAHRAEDLLGLVRDEGVRLDHALTTLLQESIDDFRGWLEESAHGRHDVAVGATTDLVSRMDAAFGERREAAKNDDALSRPPLPSANIAGPHVTVSREPGGTSGLASRSEDDLGSFETAIVFGHDDAALADDPAYREIFFELACEEINAMRDATRDIAQIHDDAREAVVAALDRLRFAAAQIGFTSWIEAIDDVASKTSAPAADLSAATLSLRERLNDEGGGPSSVALVQRSLAREASVRTSLAPPFSALDDREALQAFLARLDVPLAAIAAFGRALADDPQTGRAALEQAVEELRRAAESAGIVRLDPTFDGLLRAHGAQDVRSAEFRLYEDLATVEMRAAHDGDPLGHATRVLHAWCTDHASETLDELAELIETLDAHAPDNDRRVTRAHELLRRLRVACDHHGFDAAGDLTMALADLCGRLDSGELVSHAVLIQVMRAYVSTLDALLDAAANGLPSDSREIDSLVRAAAALTFAEGGTITSSEMERRLGLSASFHKVLTAESVAKAQMAIDANESFFIVRADLGDDESLAMRFMQWASSGRVRNISNVTVFGGAGTLFDFLVSGTFDAATLTEELLGVDATGRLVHIERVLDVHGRAKGAATATVGLGEVSSEATAAGLSGSTFEAIGEAVTRQASIQRTIARLAEADISRTILGALDANRGDAEAQRSAVEAAIALHHEELAGAAQHGAQLQGLLERLQDEALALRSRSSSLLLRPLVTLAQTTASRVSREFDATIAGEDVVLDASTLEALRSPARALVLFSVAHSLEPASERAAAAKSPHARIVLRSQRKADAIVLTVEDDGIGLESPEVRARMLEMSGASSPFEAVFREGFGPVGRHGETVGALDFAMLRRELASRGADLRLDRGSLGGFRATISMSLGLVVLDAMVVRIRTVLYVVPVAAIRRIVSRDHRELVHVPGHDERVVLRLEGGELVNVRPLAFDEGVHSTCHSSGDHLYVILGQGDLRAALAVDELLGQQLVLTRPLRGVLADIRGVTASAVVGAGAVGMVVDVPRFLEAN